MFSCLSVLQSAWYGFICLQAQNVTISLTLKADSHIACRAHAVPLPCRAAEGLECVFPIWFTLWPCLIHTCHAMPMPCSDHAVLLKATAQHVRRETACGLPAGVRLLPATARSFTSFVIRIIPISAAGGQCETKQRLSWMRKRVVAAHLKKKKRERGGEGSVKLLD